MGLFRIFKDNYFSSHPLMVTTIQVNTTLLDDITREMNLQKNVNKIQLLFCFSTKMVPPAYRGRFLVFFNKMELFACLSPVLAPSVKKTFP